MLKLRIPLSPVPASRPKVTKWGVHYGKRYTKWRKEAEKLVDEAQTTISAPCAALVTFAVEKSRTSQLVTPVGDGDNYEKAIYDLLQKKKYLEDDRLIVLGMWRKLFVPYGTPGFTDVVLYPLKTEDWEQFCQAYEQL